MIKNNDVDFITIKGDRIIYVRVALMLIDRDTIEREYTTLEGINDNYEKFVVTLDSIQLFSRGGIRHVKVWNLSEVLKDN